MNPEISQSFYAQFKDKVYTHANARGVEKPEWEDVWIQTTEFPQTAHILAEQKISPSGLSNDLTYSLLYGRPPIVLSPEQSLQHYISAPEQAVKDINNYVREFLDMKMQDENGVDFDMLVGVNKFNDFLKTKIEESNEPDIIEKTLIVRDVISSLLPAYMAQFDAVGYDYALEEVLKQLSPDLRNQAKDLNNDLIQNTLEGFTKYLGAKTALTISDSNPIARLDLSTQMKEKRDNLSPYEIVNESKKAADPFIKYLLHRNGMVAPEGYEPPATMPPQTIISEALSAYNYAEMKKISTVETTHLIPHLLTDPRIQQILVTLDREKNISITKEEDTNPMEMLFGIRAKGPDLISFRNAVVNTLTPEKVKGDSFRVKPHISDELTTFLSNSEEIVENGEEEFSKARLFGELLKKDPVKNLLASSGLAVDQQERWQETLDQAVDKYVREKNVAIDKTSTEFKINDRELNDKLEKYASDKTKLALEGKLDPVIGREEEVEQMIEILLRRGKSNPLLLGDAGVGKTALFDALATKIASGDVPDALVGAKVYTVDLHAMNSGAMYRGQFEERLLPIVDGVSERNARGNQPPTILCIDEIHSALSAGSAEGTDGARELLKPALAKGDLIVVGATTHADYVKHMEKDGALERRFEQLFVEPPTSEDTIKIIKGVKSKYSEFHKMEFSDNLIPKLVQLTDRYLPGLNQPDKALTAFDSAYASAKKRGKAEVDIATIIEIVATQAKLKPEFLQQGEGARYKAIKEQLPQMVVGQDEVLNKIADALIVAKAGLNDPNKPIGVFLLAGPTGVGKTETAKALAKLTTGTEESLIKIDFGNLGERSGGSSLFGTTPGYIGYGEEGQLSGAVRKKPYAVVLLDEVEKSDKDNYSKLLSIFDEGEVTDGKGQKINFRNTIIMMTTNLGAEEAQRAYKQGNDFLRRGASSWKELAHPKIKQAIKEHFKPEFLNRISEQLLFDPLSKDSIAHLAQRQVSLMNARLLDRWGITIDISNMGAELAERGYSEEYGARFLNSTVTRDLGIPLSNWLLDNEENLKQGEHLSITGIGNNFSINRSKI